MFRGSQGGGGDRRIVLQAGPGVIGKELLHWLGQPGSYLDYDGESRWSCTGKAAREVFADDYSEGKEYKTESGLVLLIPGRINADEHFPSHSRTTICVRTPDGVPGADPTVAQVDWLSDLTSPDVMVKGQRGSSSTGYVGFSFLRPFLRLWVPPRAYASTLHICEVLLGVQVDGILSTRGAGDSIPVTIPRSASRSQAMSWQLNLQAHGPELDKKKLSGTELKQVANYIKTQWMPQAQTQPERWRVIYVKTCGLRESQVTRALPEIKEPSPDPVLEGKFELKNRQLQRVKATKSKPAKGELQSKIETECKKELSAKGRAIPNSVFSLFESTKLVSTNDLQNPDSRHMLVWALREIAPTMQDEQLEPIYAWIMSTIASSRDACYDWGEIVNDGKRDTSEKLYVIAAWIAQDVFKMWEGLSPKDKQFLEDASLRLRQAKKWSDVQVDEIRGMLDRVKSRYYASFRCMANKEVKLSLFFLREASLDMLRARWEVVSRDGGAIPKSYFHLYPEFISNGDHEAADELVARLADAYMVGVASPGDAISYFQSSLEMQPGGNGTPSATNKLMKDLLIAFISACRERETKGVKVPAEDPGDVPGGGKKSSMFGAKAANEPAKPAQETIVKPTEPVLPRVEITFMDRLLNEFEARARGLTPRDIEDMAENLEIVLLLATGNNLVEWAHSLGNRTPLAQALLDKVGAERIAQALRSSVAPDRFFEYNDAEAKVILAGNQKWHHDHFSRRYFTEPWRSARDCTQVLWMYVKLDCALQGSSLTKFFQELEKDGTGGVLKRIAPTGSMLLSVVAKEIQQILFPPLEVGDMQKLLSYPGIFNPALKSYLCNAEAVKKTKQGLDSTQFVKLISGMVKLLSISQLRNERNPQTIMMELAQMCRTHKLNNDLIGKICENVANRNPQDFLPDRNDEGDKGFDTSNLVEVCRKVQTASEVIDYKAKGGKVQAVDKLTDKVKDVATSFLASKPNTWETIFGTIDTVIFLIEYMGKEDLGLCYDQFDRELEAAVDENSTPDEWTGNLQLRELLMVVKELYAQPIVKIDVENLAQMNNVNISEFIKQNAPRMGGPITWCGVNFKPQDWDDLLEIVGVTAAVMKDKFNVLMLPHHTQMITFIMFAIRACGVGRSDHVILPKTMLARVGTGEGKSWIIGMLAAFVAKKGMRRRKGLRAHVIIDNATLKARDYDTVSRFFEKLGIRSSMKEEHLLDPTYQVVYCTGADIWSQCRKSQEDGENFTELISQTILIVDEVDGLIIDGDTNIQYMYPDPTLSKYADYWCRQLENGIKPEAEVADPNDGTTREELTLILDRVLDAYDVAKEAIRGKDFEWRGDQMYMINKATGMLAVGWWDLWFEIRFWIDTEWQGSVTYKCIKSILCKKHCFTSYPCIFGLTGSLGQKAEHDYLLMHYEAVAFKVPYFLDTCRTTEGGVQGKPVITKLNKPGDILQEDEEEQIQRVVDLAVSKCTQVPVLVIAKDQNLVETVSAAINEKLGIAEEQAEKNEEENNARVIRLLEKPGFPQRFVKLVDTAMQPWMEKGKKQWRVTVTTAEGGRGHDYRVMDPVVDAQGGMLLILMWVSWSQREWIQFVGRTARQDHEGQLAVYLDKSSDDIADVLKKLKGKDKQSMNEKVTDMILEAGDKKMSEKFGMTSSEIVRGTLLHELTRRYWKQAKADAATDQTQESTWRNLCREYLLDKRTVGDLKSEFDGKFGQEDIAEEEEDNQSVIELGEGDDKGPGGIALGEDSDHEATAKTMCGSNFLDFIMCRCGQ